MNPGNVNQRHPAVTGDTPLLRAVRENRSSAITKVLLENGADTALCDGGNNDAMLLACGFNNKNDATFSILQTLMTHNRSRLKLDKSWMEAALIRVEDGNCPRCLRLLLEIGGYHLEPETSFRGEIW